MRSRRKEQFGIFSDALVYTYTVYANVRLGMLGCNKILKPALHLYFKLTNINNIVFFYLLKW